MCYHAWPHPLLSYYTKLDFAVQLVLTTITIRKISNDLYLDFSIFASIASNIDWHNWFWFKSLFVSLVWWGILCVSDLGNRSGIIKAFFRAVLKIMDLNMLSWTASFTSLCICTCMCITILNEAFLPFVWYYFKVQSTSLHLNIKLVKPMFIFKFSCNLS